MSRHEGDVGPSQICDVKKAMWIPAPTGMLVPLHCLCFNLKCPKMGLTEFSLEKAIPIQQARSYPCIACVTAVNHRSLPIQSHSAPNLDTCSSQATHKANCTKTQSCYTHVEQKFPFFSIFIALFRSNQEFKHTSSKYHGISNFIVQLRQRN